MAMVHCNKCTAMRALASVTIDQEKDVYLYTDVVHGHRVYSCEMTGGKIRGNGLEATYVHHFVAKRHGLIKKLEVSLQPRAVHE